MKRRFVSDLGTVMYARIVLEKCWPQIEDDFSQIFGQRTKGGLTSVYYRIRRTWGLPDVLRSEASSYEAEKAVVDQRAANFTRESLLRIGYLQKQ